EVIREQREAMRRRDTESVNELMDEARDIFFETQTHDAVRNDSAKKLAAKLMCEPVASSIATKLENDERPRFNGAADRLTQSIFVLKSEMMIISGLIDQNEKFSAMLLSEYRRISAVDVAQSGSAEFRG
ncbi:MAG: hypothetical protein IJT58_05765, partial [Synergistaceae bacterium]|nr:hypothetical protein [Synergistaceae bacterium]